MDSGKNAVYKTEFTKKAIKVGNSAGVLLPKAFLGSEVKIQVMEKPLDIKKDALEILEKYFEDILGIYLTNKTGKEVEILAVSGRLKKILHAGKYKISIVPLKLIKRDLKTQPRLKQKIIQAKTILNRALLFDLGKNLK